MKADVYLPVWVHNLPATFVFDDGGALRPAIQHYAHQGVVKKIIVGPTLCHVCVDVQRPYYRPSTILEASLSEVTA